MLNLKQLAFIFSMFGLVQAVFSQSGFTHEIGIVAGPVQFRSDYGSRSDSETNFGNMGYGIGVLYYMNFSYRKRYNQLSVFNYFNEHFKIRNEISFNKTNLEHFGKWVDPSKTSVEANKLRGHTGSASNFDIGSELEFYPIEIHSFEAYGSPFSPFASIGVHFTSFSPKVETSYANPNPAAIGDVTDASNFYSQWAPGSVDASPGTTFSLVTSVGVRYKLTQLSDLMLNLRFQYYFNDWVDGLNHNLEYNKYNDSLVWLNFGYIFYLD